MTDLDDKERRKRRMRNKRKHRLRKLNRKPQDKNRFNLLSPDEEEEDRDEIIQYLQEKNDDLDYKLKESRDSTPSSD